MSLAHRVIILLDQDNLDFVIRSTERDEETGFDPVWMFGRTFNSIINDALREYRKHRVFRANGRQGTRNAA